MRCTGTVRTSTLLAPAPLALFGKFSFFNSHQNRGSQPWLFLPRARILAFHHREFQFDFATVGGFLGFQIPLALIGAAVLSPSGNRWRRWA